MAMSHRSEDDYGRIGEAQAAWFAERLRPFEQSDWLRIGVVQHDPLPGASGPTPATLRDADTLDRCWGIGSTSSSTGRARGTSADLLGNRLPVLPAAAPGRAEILQLDRDRAAPLRGRLRTPPRALRGPPGADLAGGSEPVHPHPTRADADSRPPSGRAPTRTPCCSQRLAEVCEARDPDARIRRVDTAPRSCW